MIMPMTQEQFEENQNREFRDKCAVAALPMMMEIFHSLAVRTAEAGKLTEPQNALMNSPASWAEAAYQTADAMVAERMKPTKKG